MVNTVPPDVYTQASGHGEWLWLANTMLRPSGEKLGSWSASLLGSLVSNVCADPSECITYTCGFPPPRVLVNAIREPSGEKFGVPSAAASVVSRTGSEPSGLAT